MKVFIDVDNRRLMGVATVKEIREQGLIPREVD